MRFVTSADKERLAFEEGRPRSGQNAEPPEPGRRSCIFVEPDDVHSWIRGGLELGQVKAGGGVVDDHDVAKRRMMMAELGQNGFRYCHRLPYVMTIATAGSSGVIVARV